MSQAWTREEIELVMERAYELCLQGKHQDGFIIFEGLLALDPGNVYCLESMAALSLTMGEPQNAIDYATLALTFAPRQTEALAKRCEANVILGRLGAAQQDLEALRLLRANAHVKRLSLRMAHAGKSQNNLPPRATLRQLER